MIELCKQKSCLSEKTSEERKDNLCVKIASSLREFTTENLFMANSYSAENLMSLFSDLRHWNYYYCYENQKNCLPIFMTRWCWVGKTRENSTFPLYQRRHIMLDKVHDELIHDSTLDFRARDLSFPSLHSDGGNLLNHTINYDDLAKVNICFDFIYTLIHRLNVYNKCSQLLFVI